MEKPIQDQNKDKTKHMILLEIENLKFTQVFFLPLVSGIIIFSLTVSELNLTTTIFLNLGAIAFIIFLLSIMREIVVTRIKHLINHL